MKKGTGQIPSSGKSVDEYFGRQTSIMIVEATADADQQRQRALDVKVNVHGGGEIRPGRRRCATGSPAR